MIAESRIRRVGALPAQPSPAQLSSAQSPARRRRLVRIAGLGAAAALALAGCSAGQITQTARQHSTVGGATANLGDIALRNIQLSAPDAQEKRWAKGSNVPVELSIINNGHEEDQLVSVSSDFADSVVIFKDTASYEAFAGRSAPTASPTSTATPSPTETPTGSPTGTATASPTGTGTASPTGTPTSTASPAGATSAPPAGNAPASSPVTIPIAGSVRFGGPEDGPVILLVGLKDVLSGGQTVTLSFTFAQAGSTTVITPIDLTEGGYSNAPTVAVHEEAEEH